MAVRRFRRTAMGHDGPRRLGRPTPTLRAHRARMTYPRAAPAILAQRPMPVPPQTPTPHVRILSDSRRRLRGLADPSVLPRRSVGGTFLSVIQSLGRLFARLRRAFSYPHEQAPGRQDGMASPPRPTADCNQHDRTRNSAAAALSRYDSSQDRFNVKVLTRLTVVWMPTGKCPY